MDKVRIITIEREFGSGAPVIAKLLEVIWATCRFGASRSISGMLRAPDRRISSRVMTYTAAGASLSGSALLETDVTSTLINC